MSQEPLFFPLVKDRPDPSLTLESCPCRHCGKAGPLEVVSHCETLVGSIGLGDPNHHWYTLACPCGGKTHLEVKQGNAWLVLHEKGLAPKLLRGVPSCFEPYRYTCARCGGDVERVYVNKETGCPTTCVGWSSKYGRDSDPVYRCRGCKAEVVSDVEYYTGSDGRPWDPPKTPIEFTAEELPGSVFGNFAALARVDFK